MLRFEPAPPRPLLTLRDVYAYFLRVADGDEHIATHMLEDVWTSYCRAGSPYGRTEQGCMLWLRQSQEAFG